MKAKCAVILLVIATLAYPAAAQQHQHEPPGHARPRAFSAAAAERWVQQLSNDLDHLQEDLYYERGKYPRGLREQVDTVARAVAHFERVLREGDDPQHIREDFEQMDKQVHRLVSKLDETGDNWLQRQASRLSYSDHQLHYVLSRNPRQGTSRELLARHLDLLVNEGKDLQDLTRRVARDDEELRSAVREFVNQAEHLHETVEQGSRRRHTLEDFQEVDEAWNRVVRRINRSNYDFYLSRAAQNVNRVHNQIHDMLTENRGRDAEHVSAPAPQRTTTRRPAVQFEIPGVGRFVIPQ